MGSFRVDLFFHVPAQCLRERLRRCAAVRFRTERESDAQLENQPAHFRHHMGHQPTVADALARSGEEMLGQLERLGVANPLCPL